MALALYGLRLIVLSRLDLILATATAGHTSQNQVQHQPNVSTYIMHVSTVHTVAKPAATTPTNQTPPSYPPLPQYLRTRAIRSRPKASGTHGSPAVLRRHCPILGELEDGFGRGGRWQRATELRYRGMREFISNRPKPMGSTSWGHPQHSPECVWRATSVRK